MAAVDHQDTREATTQKHRIPRTSLRAHPLVLFTILTFVLAWAYWVPLAISGAKASHFPGLLAPALAAVLVTAATEGREGLRKLAANALRWRVPPRWYAFALVPLAVGAIVVASSG